MIQRGFTMMSMLFILVALAAGTLRLALQPAWSADEAPADAAVMSLPHEPWLARPRAEWALHGALRDGTPRAHARGEPRMRSDALEASTWSPYTPRRSK